MTFVAIEGIDGAGKQTLATQLRDLLYDRHRTVEVFAYPRYGHSLYADLAQEAREHRHGDLISSVYGMGLLYALDRRDFRRELRVATALSEVVLCDRYVASNIAYGAARCGENIDGDYAQWVEHLEFTRFDAPTPDLHVLLDIAPELAGRRREQRGTQDAYEVDEALQEAVSQRYRDLAAAEWRSPWIVLDGATAGFEKLVEALLRSRVAGIPDR